ncbi:MAG TPA: hypothetical protein VGS19_37100 [Streptosporangiaceae bacterium]|nr:hypothetical protein [Streptosporangiaceae bacterium]
MHAEAGSAWLVLDADGVISRWDLARGTCTEVATASVPAEPGHRPWCGHELRRRLHAAASGRFAAVVNDFGRLGEVIDLRDGRVTMSLDNDGYYEETVPFSLAFACHRGRDVVIHRTDWNRLDVSDAATGDLLTARGPTSYRSGDPQPEHYLDYFHGALSVSPDGARVYDDGWFWHPVGIPAAWNLESWLDGNPWESEDGPTKTEFCDLESWNQAFTWVGSDHVAVYDTGDGDTQACTRVFDVGKAAPSNSGSTLRAAEVAVLHGPRGRFFSDGTALLSSSDDGLSRWNPITGECTATLPGFTPAYYHPATKELIEVSDSGLRRARLTGAAPG